MEVQPARGTLEGETHREVETERWRCSHRGRPEGETHREVETERWRCSQTEGGRERHKEMGTEEETERGRCSQREGETHSEEVRRTERETERWRCSWTEGGRREPSDHSFLCQFLVSLSLVIPLRGPEEHCLVLTVAEVKALHVRQEVAKVTQRTHPHKHLQQNQQSSRVAQKQSEPPPLPSGTRCNSSLLQKPHLHMPHGENIRLVYADSQHSYQTTMSSPRDMPDISPLMTEQV